MAEFERLTVESNTISGYVLRDMCTWGRDGQPTDESDCLDICYERQLDCDNCPIQKAFNRLAEYENIGLSPEEIRELKERGKNG